MATWKKVVVSGSEAQFSALKVDNLTSGQAVIGGGNAGNLTSKAITGTGNLIANGASGVQLTGSFTGSFKGDGSQLTGLSVAITSYTNPGDNRLITGTGTSTTVNGESNLTFDGTLLTVTGRADITGAITGSNLRLDGTILDGAGETTVLVIDPTGNVKSDEIDSRVWGTSLVDGTGTANQVAYWSDSNTVTGDTGFTYNAGTDVLTVGTSTFGTDVTIAGNLTVNGTTTTLNTTNILVEDRFVLLNSGSATGDGGIIVQTETNGTGAAFGWYDTSARFSLQTNTKLAGSATAIVPDAFIAAVVDEAASMTDIPAYQKNGNIRITAGGDIFIYS